MAREESSREDRRLLSELCRAIAAGDRRAQDHAFEAIWHRHAAAVSLICARYLADDGDILDVTDEVFLRLFRAAPTLCLTGSLRAYLATLARNTAIDRCRSAVRRAAHLSEPGNGVTDPLAAIPDPDADVGASIRYRELVASLRALLSTEEVEIILAHAVWGETFGSIATRLGQKENSVKSRYHRALKTYREKKGGDLT